MPILHKPTCIAVALVIAFGTGYFIQDKTCTDCHAQTADIEQTISSLNTTEFASAIDRHDAELIDIRTAEEYETGRINGAVNQDFYQKDRFNVYLKSLDKNKPYLIYCRSGNRSNQALDIMRNFGFTNVSDLSGGIAAWQQANLPVVN